MDPQTIIKSQIVDDKELVDLNEILEKYGTDYESGNKSITLQIYSKEALDDGGTPQIVTDTSYPGYVLTNTAITITKFLDDDDIYIRGVLADNTMNLKNFIHIPAGEYENGIILSDAYPFDVHVIKV